MNTFLSEAKWIWYNDNAAADEYGEFVDSFPYNGGEALLQISADSKYAAYLNGNLIAIKHELGNPIKSTGVLTLNLQLTMAT